MRSRMIRRVLCAAGSVALIVAVTPLAAGASPLGAPSSGGRALAPGTRFMVRTPDSGALEQIAALAKSGDLSEAALIARMEAVPQAVWFTSGTPQEVQRQVRETMFDAFLQRAVPVLVAYDIPGRDCAQYSAGGALSDADYQQWVSAFAQGIGGGKAVVILEPDSLADLPSDCAAFGTSAYPFTDAGRLADINYAVSALEADPNVSVYLDAGNSAWQPVGTIAQSLVEAGVQKAQGFFLNVSNYQYTSNTAYYGTWVSDCIAYATVVSPGNFGTCPNQYWNGGPATNWSGTAMDRYGIWSDGNAQQDLNTAGTDSWYASLLNGATPTTHFVIDTSRSGQGPNDMETYGQPPYNQSAATISTLQSGNWCNPPGAGLGVLPTANTGQPLVDAYLWVKTPGESDGQCDAAGGVRAWDYTAYTQPGWPTTASDQALFDPLWGIDDPAAGAWFTQQAIQLAQNANPALPSGLTF